LALASEDSGMEATRERAYHMLLSASLLHIKWDLACLFGGIHLTPWGFSRQMRACRRAACRAFAFHNLAILASQNFEGFSEGRFWGDVERFLKSYPESGWSDYRSMFERCLRGEEIDIIAPGG
jgi:hypothetical protein